MGKKKQQASKVYWVRIKAGPITDHLDRLPPGAPSCTIRQAVEEWYSRRSEALHAQAEAIRADCRVREAEADRLNLMAIEARKEELTARQDEEDQRRRMENIVLGVLTQRRKEGKPVGSGWIDSPAGREVFKKNGVAIDFAIELAKRGMG